eukprot:6200993-Pleurochrysis_carterae.AAC.1
MNLSKNAIPTWLQLALRLVPVTSESAGPFSMLPQVLLRNWKHSEYCFKPHAMLILVVAAGKLAHNWLWTTVLTLSVVPEWPETSPHHVDYQPGHVQNSAASTSVDDFAVSL